MAAETPAVDAAVEVAKGRNDTQQTRIKRHIAEWAETDKAVERVAERPTFFRFAVRRSSATVPS